MKDQSDKKRSALAATIASDAVAADAARAGVRGSSGIRGGFPARSPVRSTAQRRTLVAGQVDQAALLSLTGYNLRRAGLTMQAAFEQCMADHRLTQAEFSALVLVHDNVEINQKNLADALAISPPNMAVLLERLEARALLTRERKAADRRSHVLTLTAEGKDLYGRATTTVRALDEQTTGMLNEDERQQLNRLLQRLFRAPPLQ